MKLIVCGLDALSGFVSREFYYIINTLIAEYGWRQIETRRLWKLTGSIRDRLLNATGELPTTILFWESFDFLSAYAAEIRRLDCFKVIFVDDLHWRDNAIKQNQLTSYALADLVLSTYAYLWPEYCRQPIEADVVWIPHSATRDFRVPFNRRPENGILLSGSVNRYYPLRQRLEALAMADQRSIVQHRHPGYQHWYRYREKGDVGRGYATLINRYRAAFTDSSIYGYVVAKYFEIPATGTLLLADDKVRSPLKELGFVENHHYLPVDEEDLEEKIRYVLDESNHSELDQIRKRGQDLVWQRHKTSDRARQINAACKLRTMSA